MTGVSLSGNWLRGFSRTSHFVSPTCDLKYNLARNSPLEILAQTIRSNLNNHHCFGILARLATAKLPTWFSDDGRYRWPNYNGNRRRSAPSLFNFFSPTMARNIIRRRAFFIEQRNQHYRVLNEQAFKPIQRTWLDLNAYPTQNTWGRLNVQCKFGTGAGPVDLVELMPTPAFRDAVKHLETDAPNVPTALLDLSASIRKLNEDADKFQANLRDKTIEACSNVAPLNFGVPKTESYINVNAVIKVLEAWYMEFYESYFSGGEPYKDMSDYVGRREALFEPRKVDAPYRAGITPRLLSIHDNVVYVETSGQAKPEETELWKTLEDLRHDESVVRFLAEICSK